MPSYYAATRRSSKGLAVAGEYKLGSTWCNRVLEPVFILLRCRQALRAAKPLGASKGRVVLRVVGFWFLVEFAAALLVGLLLTTASALWLGPIPEGGQATVNFIISAPAVLAANETTYHRISRWYPSPP